MKTSLNKIFVLSLPVTLFGLPAVVFAQRSGGIRELILAAGNIIDTLIPMVAALALLFFFWGIAQFIKASGSGDEAMLEKAKDVMGWGIIALFVMVSIWGIVRIMQQDLGVPDIRDISTPGF